MPVFDSEAHLHALEKEQCRRAKDWHRHWVVAGGSAAEAKSEDVQPLPNRLGHAGLGPSPKWLANAGPSPRSGVGILAKNTSNLRTVGGLVALQIGEPKPRNTSKALRIRTTAPEYDDKYPNKLQELKSDARSLGFCFKSDTDATSPRPSPRVFGVLDESNGYQKVPCMPPSVEYFGRKHHLTHTRDAYRSSGAFGATMEA